MSTNEEKRDLTSLSDDIEEYDDSLITQLTTKQQRFVHLYLTGQYTVNKLAQLLELHPNTLFKWLKRDDVKAVIADMQTTTHDMVGAHLKALTLKAVNRLDDLVNSPIDGVSLQAVKDILDRAGHKSKTEIKVDKTVRTYEEKLKNLIEDTVVDAEFEEVDDDD